MSFTRELIEKLNENTAKDNPFWKDPPKNPTFEEVLKQYSKYLSDLLDSTKREDLAKVFWDQIEKVGTPIIEDLSDDEVKVYFLFPWNKDLETTKLYIAGDFHGFSSTDDVRQEMHHNPGTDIMYRIDVMPRNSVVTYCFLQVPIKFQNKSRKELIGEVMPESFYGMEDIPKLGVDPLPQFKKSDKYAKHNDIIGYSIFCANVDNDLSGIKLLKDTDWEKLLTKKYPNYLKNLTHKGTYLCDEDNHLRKDKNASDNYLWKIQNSKEGTRSVSVFQSGNGKIDNLIIIHDGAGYMGTGAIENIDALIGEGKIPKNTAIICISPLPGLIEKYKKQSTDEFATATDARPVEFASRIDDYIKFIDQSLTQLGYSNVPAENRTLIGASMSGTASIFMVLKHKDKFGRAIAQAPTEGTREILRPLMQERIHAKELNKEVEDLSARIHLSCGKFETLQFSQNIRLEHTEQLAEILGSHNQALHVDASGNYGHLSHCWSQELTKALPTLFPKAELTSTSKLAKSFGITHSSSNTSMSEEDRQPKKNVDDNKVKKPSVIVEKQSDTSAHKTPTPFSRNLTKK